MNAHTSSDKRVLGWEGRTDDDLLPESFEYPNKLIKIFEEALKSCEFEAAQSALNEVFGLLSAIPVKAESIPDFFIRNVLIDLLSVLTLSMNETRIPFTDYENEYLETLYLCRSCVYDSEDRKSVV